MRPSGGRETTTQEDAGMGIERKGEGVRRALRSSSTTPRWASSCLHAAPGVPVRSVPARARQDQEVHGRFPWSGPASRSSRANPGAAGKRTTRTFPTEAAAQLRIRQDRHFPPAERIHRGKGAPRIDARGDPLGPGGRSRRPRSRMAFADYLAERGEELPAVAYRVDEAGYGEPRHGGFANLRIVPGRTGRGPRAGPRGRRLLGH